jgi:hypothetical protein
MDRLIVDLDREFAVLEDALEEGATTADRARCAT